MTTRVVVVEIAGQQYPIRSALDDGYVATLAAYVEQKMRAASDVAPYGPPVQALRLKTKQDGRTLERRPRGTWSLSFEVWLAEP